MDPSLGLLRHCFHNGQNEAQAVQAHFSNVLMSLEAMLSQAMPFTYGEKYAAVSQGVFPFNFMQHIVC